MSLLIGWLTTCTRIASYDGPPFRLVLSVRFTLCKTFLLYVDTTGLPADWPIIFRHIMPTQEEVAAISDIEEWEALSDNQPIGSEEAPPWRSIPSVPTRTVATAEGIWSTHSGPSAWTEPRNTLRRFLRSSGPFIDVAKPKGTNCRRMTIGHVR